MTDEVETVTLVISNATLAQLGAPGTEAVGVRTVTMTRVAAGELITAASEALQTPLLTPDDTSKEDTNGSE